MKQPSSVYTRLKFLTQQRRILLCSTLFMLVPVLLFLYANFLMLWNILVESGVLSAAISVPDQLSVLALAYFFLPFMTSILLINLAFLLRRNVQIRVIRSESFWIALFGVLIPCLIWSAGNTAILEKWYGIISLTAWCWISIGVATLLITLVVNLRQYSAAIRKARMEQEEKSPEEWSYTRMRELRDQRFFLIGATIMELLFASATAVTCIQTLMMRDPMRPASLVNLFAFPASCLVLLVALVAFNRKNREAPMMHRSCSWIIVFGILLPTLLWIACMALPISAAGRDTASALFSCVILLFLLPLNYQLLGGLHRYTKEIERERKSRQTV